METLRGFPVKRNVNGNVTFGKSGLVRMSGDDFLRNLQDNSNKNVQTPEDSDSQNLAYVEKEPALV